MNSKIEAEILDRSVTYSLSEVCERGGVHAEFVVELVEHGIIAPATDERGQQWLFDIGALSRLQRVRRLRRDLEINLPGIALALDLLDDMQQMQYRLEQLDRQLRQLLNNNG